MAAGWLSPNSKERPLRRLAGDGAALKPQLFVMNLNSPLRLKVPSEFEVLGLGIRFGAVMAERAHIIT
jgi:hypothetical protein